MTDDDDMTLMARSLRVCSFCALDNNVKITAGMRIGPTWGSSMAGGKTTVPYCKVR